MSTLRFSNKLTSQDLPPTASAGPGVTLVSTEVRGTDGAGCIEIESADNGDRTVSLQFSSPISYLNDPFVVISPFATNQSVVNIYIQDVSNLGFTVGFTVLPQPYGPFRIYYMAIGNTY